MKKRVLSAVLWAYVVWYGCEIVGTYAGFALPGALVGLAAGALVFAMPVLRGPSVAPASLTSSCSVPLES